MFPLTRQSFITTFAVLLTTMCVCSGNNDQSFSLTSNDLWADDGPNGNSDPDTVAPPPAAVAPAAPQWQQPAWYMDEAAANTFQRQKIRILQFLKQNNMNAGQRSEVHKLAHFYLSQMTHEEVRQSIPKDVTSRMNSDILSSSNRPESRAVLMDEIIKEVPKILNHPSPIVRTNAVMMLTELSIEPASFQTKTPARPYAPVYKILNDILGDTQQLAECKVIAARGLGRLCRDSANNSLTTANRSDVAIALTNALKATPPGSADEVWWLRYRIVDALGYVDRLGDINNNPIVIDSILEVLSNPKEELIVRSQAALSISRLPYAGSTNVQLITHEICQLTLRLSVEFKKDKSNPKGPQWRTYFSRVYIAFRPELQSEADNNWGLLYQVKRGGLGGSANYVNQAFALEMPIIKSIVEPEHPGPIPDAALKALTDWVKTNKPTDRKVTPKSKPLPE